MRRSQPLMGKGRHALGVILWVVVFASVIIFTAIVSHYPGFLSLEWSWEGGSIILDGRVMAEAAK